MAKAGARTHAASDWLMQHFLQPVETNGNRWLQEQRRRDGWRRGKEGRSERRDGVRKLGRMAEKISFRTTDAFNTSTDRLTGLCLTAEIRMFAFSSNKLLKEAGANSEQLFLVRPPTAGQRENMNAPLLLLTCTFSVAFRIRFRL